MKQVVAGSTAAAALSLLLLTVIVTAILSSMGLGGATSTTGGATWFGGLREGKIPDAFVPWVNKAGALCNQESPALIAAQLWAESGFDVSARSRAGAQGPAQFMPSTWGAWGQDADGNGVASPTDIGDAVMAQGRLMCDLLGTATRSGFAGGAVPLALAGYNAGWGNVQKYGGIPPFAETATYVQKITAKAAQWAAPPPQAEATPQLEATPGSGVGAAAVTAATAWVGTPYVYGGGSPSGPSSGWCDGSKGMLNGVCFAKTHSGFDCSSLVQFAWWPTIHLPRTADEQHKATAAHTVTMATMQPGDLIFIDHGKGIDHVVIYAGNNKVVEAPHTGASVRVVPLSSAGVVAVTRPA